MNIYDHHVYIKPKQPKKPGVKAMKTQLLIVIILLTAVIVSFYNQAHAEGYDWQQHKYQQVEQQNRANEQYQQQQLIYQQEQQTRILRQIQQQQERQIQQQNNNINTEMNFGGDE